MVRPLPELVLFVDECLGSTDVPAALGAAGIECERLKDHFAGGAADEDWLAHCRCRFCWKGEDAGLIEAGSEEEGLVSDAARRALTQG